MKYLGRVTWIIAVAISITAHVASAKETYSIAPVTELGRFNVIDGQPMILKGDGPPGNALDVKQAEQSEIRHYASGKPLAYPSQSERSVVSLGAGADKETEWTFTHVKHRGGSEIVTVQAARGKFRDWYLDCAETEETLSIGGKDYTVRRLVLVKEPKQIKHWTRYVVAP